jgi:hypothetical protein
METPEGTERGNVDKNQKVTAGIIVGVMAVLAIVYAASTFAKTDDQAACSLTTAAVTLIGEGLSNGHSPARIATTAAIGATAGSACAIAINQLANHPDAKVMLKVQTAAGEVAKTTTGNELTALPTPTLDNFSRNVRCLKWESYLLQKMCFNGDLGPPVDASAVS